MPSFAPAPLRGILTAVILATTAGTALASPAPSPVSLSVTAPCADADEFSGQLRMRTDRIAPAHEGEPSTAIRLQIVPRGSGFHGTLAIDAPGSSPSRRVIAGATCEEVVEALALVAALSLDPNARTAPVRELPVAPPAVSSAPPTPPPPPTASAHEPPVPPPPAVVAPPRREAPAPPTRSPSAPVHFGAGVRPQIVTGIGPDPVFSLPVWLELLRGPWLARLAFERTAIHDVPAGTGTAHWTWTVGRGEACFRSRLARSWDGVGCGFFEAGLVRAGAEGVASPRDAARTWMATGPMIALDWSPAPALFVELAAGLRVPITRDRFYILPDTTVHRPPAVAPFAGLGIGGRIP